MLTKGLGATLAAALIMAIHPALAQGTRVTLTFTPESKTAAFEAAAAEYRSIWEAEGARIIEAMEHLTTLRFPQKKIAIQIFEGPSNASLLFNRAFGRTLKGLYDYDTAWTWTLAMTREERASRFAGVLKANAIRRAGQS